MPQPVFYDPKKKRWVRLRLLFNVLGVTVAALIVFFVVSVSLSPEQLPKIVLKEQGRKLKSLKERARHQAPLVKTTHRRTKSAASDVVLNSDEGIRAGFYVTWDAASFVSLKQYYPQIDILFAEWLHVLGPDGTVQAVYAANQLFGVAPNGSPVGSGDEEVMPFLKSEKPAVDVRPLLNHVDPLRRQRLNNN